MSKFFIVLIGMSVLTYLPRMLPMVVLKDLKLPPFFKSFFEFIPFAALGALIFPGIISSTGDEKSAVMGTLISVVLAFFRVNVVIVVLGGILGVYLYQTLM
ncbi:AzlD domain-containing protein [Fonticella tunisiensis]|uniref:Branched-subunit amino acid transport protein n=1 Tax=Fonticella tunisiensis TaxID=1096341 RepID=A0A4R7KAJ8_9CLOT|nr:AzlD domain-containing protein [Fonticella tunisiensis]TDT51041.1 branched-subunit amino acid transport protein [Fonticella tunisiensis]